jgi:hypothetical protein
MSGILGDLFNGDDSMVFVIFLVLILLLLGGESY